MEFCLSAKKVYQQQNSNKMTVVFFAYLVQINKYDNKNQVFIHTQEILDRNSESYLWSCGDCSDAFTDTDLLPSTCRISDGSHFAIISFFWNTQSVMVGNYENYWFMCFFILLHMRLETYFWFICAFVLNSLNFVLLQNSIEDSLFLADYNPSHILLSYFYLCFPCLFFVVYTNVII